jgi:hypothetical protein
VINKVVVCGGQPIFVDPVGCAPDITDVQALFPYEIHLRAKGDFDGDFDVDDLDPRWDTCLGYKSPCSYSLCFCAALDFDADCDIDLKDMEAFFRAKTGALPGCHSLCHTDTDPPVEGMRGGWSGEEVSVMPEGCELAAWYATIAPREQVMALTARLLQLMDESPEIFDQPESYEFLQCIYAILD